MDISLSRYLTLPTDFKQGREKYGFLLGVVHNVNEKEEVWRQGDRLIDYCNSSSKRL